MVACLALNVGCSKSLDSGGGSFSKQSIAKLADSAPKQVDDGNGGKPEGATDVHNDPAVPVTEQLSLYTQTTGEFRIQLAAALVHGVTHYRLSHKTAGHPSADPTVPNPVAPILAGPLANTSDSAHDLIMNADGTATLVLYPGSDKLSSEFKEGVNEVEIGTAYVGSQTAFKDFDLTLEDFELMGPGILSNAILPGVGGGEPMLGWGSVYSASVVGPTDGKLDTLTTEIYDMFYRHASTVSAQSGP